MELSDFRQLASIFFAFFGGAGLMYAVATVVVGRGGKTRTAKERVKDARKTQERFAKEANEQLTGQAARQIQFEALEAYVERSLWPDWIDELRQLAFATQTARLDRNTSSLSERFLPAALDALLAGPPLDSVKQIYVSALRLRRASALPSGASATLRLHLLVEEVFGEEVRLVESLEDWILGWPPGDTNFRVINVDRIWRRRVEPPLLNLTPLRPPTKLLSDPDLDANSPALQGWDLETEGAALATAWLLGEELDLHPHAQEQRTAEDHRYAFFQSRWTCHDVVIQSVKVARIWRTERGWLIGIQVTATHQVQLSGPQESRATTEPRLWVGYLTVWRPDEGPMQLTGVDQEVLWSV